MSNFESAKKYIDYKFKTDTISISGPGSYIHNAKTSLNFINKVIKEKKINSILDLGCGDWNWFKEVELGTNISYLGYDCSNKLININTEKYGNKNIKFEVKDISTCEFPKVDLIICRDVLFHIDKNITLKIIDKIKQKCDYFISTSFLKQKKNNNINKYLNIENWGFYHINLNICPFDLKSYMIDSEEETNINNRYICLYKF